MQKRRCRASGPKSRDDGSAAGVDQLLGRATAIAYGLIWQLMSRHGVYAALWKMELGHAVDLQCRRQQDASGSWGGDADGKDGVFDRCSQGG